MAQQTLLGGDGTTGETGATHNSKANSNFTELYAATAAAQADADAAESAISSHVSASPAHIAANIAFTPVGTIGATNIQDAIAEVAVEAGATVPDATETVEGIAELATQAETNTGTDDLRIVTPLKLKNRDGAVATLTDASTVDITSDKNTLTTSAATRTFTISHTGDETVTLVTLNTSTATWTFPSGSLCLGDAGPSGDNTCVVAGTSGDVYSVATKKIGSVYSVICINIGQ